MNDSFLHKIRQIIFIHTLNNKLVKCFFLHLCLLSNPLSAQIIKIPIQKPITIATDKNNRLFVADEKGNINQYDTTGKLLLNYSPQRIGEIQIIDVWQTVKIFVFYREFQQFTFLDRFLNMTATYAFDFEQIGFAKAATLGLDGNIWVMDNTDFSIKKYNPITDKIIAHTSLDLLLNPQDYEIQYMREYQNLLFVCDKNSGILIFDIFGNYKNTLPYTDVVCLTTWENEICFLKGNTLICWDLYKSKERKITLPENEKWLFAAILGDKIAALTEKALFLLNE